jgi:hypothetical protein
MTYYRWFTRKMKSVPSGGARDFDFGSHLLRRRSLNDLSDIHGIATTIQSTEFVATC